MVLVQGARPPSPGMKPSQMPDWARWHKGWLPLSQPLKSPVTQTCAASGAHTAKWVPAASGSFEHMGSQLMIQAVVIAFVKEVEIVVGQKRDVVPHRGRGSLGLGLGLFVCHTSIFLDSEVYCKD